MIQTVRPGDLRPTDTVLCEACWTAQVQCLRLHPHGRDLLCRGCAESGCPPRVELFPPLGIYGVTYRGLGEPYLADRHRGPGSPQTPPHPGPPLPSPPPQPTPGRPPV
ncbi:hypothetical protein BJP40_26865 [Streptomyces sp. CC53]|uniref:hypothetical protein n=1 Tax=Streptomyces sp. CC53 TaxID=1906740 RepID=UPI0008DC7478|nr:hypothetical protein [Streptomyces sp. CC53]OII62862.1 hypothetical protein BJP40_26865 [Streptomyces sp. CC53]